MFIKTFLGLLKDRIWFSEYLNKEYTLINRNPELVEKKDPPIITNIKKINVKFFWFVSKENPILDILLTIDKRFNEKLLLKLKKRKKIAIIDIK